METGLNKKYYAKSLKQCSKTPCFLGDYMGVVPSNIFFGFFTRGFDQSRDETCGTGD